MFKIQFCGNIAQKCLASPLFKSKTTLTNRLNQLRLLSNKSWPEISDNEHEQEHRTRTKVHFKHRPPNNIRSLDHDSWQNHREPTSNNNESEQEFLVRVKNNPDEFGDSTLQTEYLDEGDILEEKHFTEQPSPHKKLRTQQYADIIKSYIRQRKIKEAIDVVEIRMLKEDRVKPENYLYNLLLGGCGRVGYTKKAFMLYNDMKKRGLKVTPGTYTALFNACANSPWPLTDGLSRAKHLYEIMIEKGHQPNDTNYNVMIKAFGRCGDLPMSFSLVDEMADKGFSIRDDTINSLLQACITDKEAGFRHSLLVWRKMIEKNIRPSVYTFNLMLRCVRDCELDATQDVLNELVGGEISFPAISESPSRLALQESGKEESASSISENVECPPDGQTIPKDFAKIVDENSNQSTISMPLQESPPKESIGNCDLLRPNLLARKPHLGNIISLSEVKRPEDRLLLLGGCKGFLETMSDYKVTPDIKTFTQLLDCIPSTLAAEKELIVALRKANVKADTDFYNMLIKKKSMRSDYEGAKEVLISMKQNKICPDLITYGVLSLGCKTKEEAVDLIDQMRAFGYSVNAVILGTMLKQACVHMQFHYIFEVMELCLKESVPVNKKFLEHLKTFKEMCKAKMEAKGLNQKEVKMFSIFKARYNTWLTEVQIDESEDAHPWQQYRQTYPENVRYKPKDFARFKPRHTSQFRVKTSTKHRY